MEIILWNKQNGVEPCLLETNVTTPLGLMIPASGVEPRGEQVEQDNSNPPTQETVVRLLQAQRIPGRCEAIAHARLEGQIARPEEVLFEPNDEWLKQTGLQVEDCLLIPEDNLNVHLIIRNPTSETKKIASDVAIGRAESPENPPEMVTRMVYLQNTQTHDTVNEIQRKERLARLLEKSGQKFTAEDKHIRDCVLEAHDVFAVDDVE